MQNNSIFVSTKIQIIFIKIYFIFIRFLADISWYWLF